MRKTKILGLHDVMLFNAKELYLSYLSQKKWKVAHERIIEEDFHDDLLVAVGTSLRNYNSLGQSGLAISFKEMRQAFQLLDKVVGVQKGADCGLFSLPAILESFLRMIRKQWPDVATSFLSQAVQLAKVRFGEDHPFAQVLLNLQKIQMEDSQQLADVIFTVYRSCIEHVENNLGSFHLTTLQLWGDFVVYLGGSSINQTRAAVDNIRRVIRKSETENGLDHDYTLELLGLTLYVLQSDLTMAEEAEDVALDIFQRVERIKANTGGKLEGDLLIKRKDLKQTLGTLRLKQKDYEKAIEYLEEFFHNEVMDGRDTQALQMLEGCYTSLGKLEKAKMVQKRRMETSQILLRQDEVKTAEDDKACTKEEEPAESVDGGCIEGTAVDDFENPNEKEDQDEENEEEDDDSTDEVRDVEVEKQLLREQISEMEQRLKALEKNGKKKEKKSSA
jgi:tetratricopeptide (TPR) repeat protein